MNELEEQKLIDLKRKYQTYRIFDVAVIVSIILILIFSFLNIKFEKELFRYAILASIFFSIIAYIFCAFYLRQLYSAMDEEYPERSISVYLIMGLISFAKVKERNDKLMEKIKEKAIGSGIDKFYFIFIGSPVL